MRTVVGRAYARAGLLGNPSDVYEGKAIAVSIRDFSARVVLETAPHFEFVAGEAESLRFDHLSALVEHVRARGSHDGLRLLRAATARFAAHWPELERIDSDDPRLRFRMSYETDVPRQVGLAGSSAIVVSALRALAEWFEVEIPASELAELALAAETEELGITAGPMDRVIQAYGGGLIMDFATPRTAASYRPLDPAQLPALFLAWWPGGGSESTRPHSDVRLRYLRGDREVRRAVEALADLVEPGVACLERGDHAGFAKLVRENFALRESIFPMRARDRELVSIGSRCGAATKFAGSGGAVVGVLEDPGIFTAVERAYREAGARALRPEIAAG